MYRMCPFCLKDIEKEEVALKFFSTTTDDFTQWEIYKYCEDNPEIDFPMKRSRDEKYNKFWRLHGVSEERQSILLNKVKLQQFIQDLNREDMFNSDGELDYTYVIPEHNTRITFKFDSERMRLSMEENGESVFSTIACPECHNDLPIEFFKYPQIMIGLLGNKSAGKTTTLCSVLYDNLKAINGSLGILSFEEMQIDSKIAAMRLDLEKNGIVPAATGMEFIPPVILKVKRFFHESNAPQIYMLCIYDVSGEALQRFMEMDINQINGIDQLFTPYIKTDGWIFLENPRNTDLYQMNPGEIEKEKILAQCKVEEGNNQIASQSVDRPQRFNELLKNLMKIERLDSTRFINNLISIANLEQYGQGVRRGNNQRISFVLSQADELKDNLLLKKWKSLFFEQNNIDYLSDEYRGERQERKQILEEVFNEYIYDVRRWRGDSFNSVDVYIAAALGSNPRIEEDEEHKSSYRLQAPYAPIRVGEVFVDMVYGIIADRQDE